MASNRQRGKVNKRLWGKLRSLSHCNAHLEDDPLGSLYDVNRFGINVEMISREQAEELRQKLIADLRAEGWTFDTPEHSYSAVTGRKPDYDGYIHIGHAHWTIQEDGRFKIGVH